MATYTINYHTGVTEEFEGTLEGAKQSALEGISYTQEHVSIEQDGEQVTIARWFGVEADEDDEVLVHVGDGFYQNWSDQLGE